jgi:hypothetical protein
LSHCESCWVTDLGFESRSVIARQLKIPRLAP